MSSKVFLDVECYSNYFLICFKSRNNTKFFQMYDDQKPIDIVAIHQIMTQYTTVGFNSSKYDLWMIAYAMLRASNSELKILSDELINSDLPAWQLCKKYNINIPYKWAHIDLIEPSPAVGVGLKMYGARMHTKTLQDLPLEPSSIITADQHILIREYCLNDVNITIDLYNRIKDRIDLRDQIGKVYNLSLTSKSDAQVAEAIFKHCLQIKKSPELSKNETSYKYNSPSYIKFQSEEINNFLKELEAAEFQCDDVGRIVKNSDIRKKVTIAGTEFAVGIGGLHSNEKHRATVSASDEFLIDVDVVSYYPSIILNNSYYPEICGKEFLDIYKNFYNSRIEAKKNQDKIKSETYKIILNGSFGKFGSRYSFLYSPSLLLHTTLTGQLTLLMLIEKITLAGFKVISANTDGVTVRGAMNALDDFNEVIKQWEYITNFKLEYTFYKAIYHESVNSYVAILEDNTIKCKGAYGADGLTKNPSALICKEAAIAYLQNRTPIPETIYQNKTNITKFLIVRKVTGGAMYKEQYLGKIVRWYYGLTGDKIVYKKNGNKVAGSDGAVPLMEIPITSPSDINIGFYVNKTYEMLENLGVKH